MRLYFPVWVSIDKQACCKHFAFSCSLTWTIFRIEVSTNGVILKQFYAWNNLFKMKLSHGTKYLSYKLYESLISKIDLWYFKNSSFRNAEMLAYTHTCVHESNSMPNAKGEGGYPNKVWVHYVYFVPYFS